LNTPYFIARRLRSAGSGSFTTVAHRIGIVGIALGLSTMLLAFLCLGGFQKNIKKKIYSFHGQLQLMKYQSGSSMQLEQAAYLPRKFDRSISSLRPYAMKTALIQLNDEVEGVLLKGLQWEKSETSLIPYLVSGQMPASNNKNEIVISDRLAKQQSLNVGDKIVACFVQNPPRYRKLTIVGVYSTSIPEVDDKIILCNLQLIQNLNGWSSDRVEGFEIFLNDGVDATSLRRQILTSLEYNLLIKTTQRTFLPIFEWLSVSGTHVLILIFLILLVACSNIVSIMLIQVMERVKMIGILKTLGATDSFVRRIFFWSGLHILSKGMFWGNIIALSLAVLQHYGKFIKLDPESYYMHYLVIDWNWKAILFFNIITFSVITVVLSTAVYLMTKVKPITAIRFN